MRSVTAVWMGLDPRRRVIAALATVAMFAAVLFLARVASTPSMTLLYAGLEGSRSGEVLQALDQRGAIYEVRGSAIYVEARHRDELRMSLAAEGLPQSGGTGYELLDTLSGFGTTSQMFDAAFLRAKEGELARTIMSLPQVRNARVHVADARANGLRPTARPTASVTVTTTDGGISPAHAKALKFLVASAFAGMSPDDVSVIDGEGALVETGDDPAGKAADDRAEALRANVERLLEARVGYGNAVVEVSVEPVTDREAITERTFDPASRVAISTDTEESSVSASDSGKGAVTVASNLPSGDAAESGRSSQSQNSSTRERTNFEVSETTREILRTPGAVRRLTVAVLVDGIAATSADGTAMVEPRSDEELSALRDLVAAAVGFDESRGDVITIKSMSFEPITPAEAAADAAPFLAGLSLDLMSIMQLAVLAVVSLILGLFVVRPILTSRGSPAALPLPAPGRPPEPGAALTGEIDDAEFPPRNLSVVPDRERPAFPPPEDADPVTRLRKLIADRQDESVEILRGWMEDAEEEGA